MSNKAAMSGIIFIQVQIILKKYIENKNEKYLSYIDRLFIYRFFVEVVDLEKEIRK